MNSTSEKPVQPRFGDGAISGAALMMAAKAVGFSITFLATAIIARILSPADYGLVAMVTTIVIFFVVFSDFGLTLVTVQRPVLTNDQVSTLFWLNAALGLLLGAATAALGPALVWFYGDHRLLSVALVSSLFFPLAALGAQHQAMLKRQMKFRRLALARLSGGCAGPIGGILLAWYDWGHFALVGQFLITTAVTSLAAWAAYPWRPGRPRGCEDLGSILSFGGALTGHGMIGYFANNMDNVLLGKFAGATQLGIYNTSYLLMMRPISLAGYGVGETAIPAMSRARTAAEMKDTFRRMFTLTCLLGLPVCAAGAWWADDVVFTMLGDQWVGAIPVLRVLFLAAAARMLCTATGWAYIASGRPGRMVRWQIMWTAAAMLAFLAGLQKGAVGVATAYALAMWIAVVPCFLYCFHGTALNLMDVFQPGAGPLACSVAATALAVVGQSVLSPDMASGPVRLAMRIGIAIPTYSMVTILVVPLVNEGFHEFIAKCRAFFGFPGGLALPAALSAAKEKKIL